jgi:hypothetical protein
LWGVAPSGHSSRLPLTVIDGRKDVAVDKSNGWTRDREVCGPANQLGPLGSRELQRHLPVQGFNSIERWGDISRARRAARRLGIIAEHHRWQ